MPLNIVLFFKEIVKKGTQKMDHFSHLQILYTNTAVLCGLWLAWLAIAVLPSKTSLNCTLNTIQYGGNIHHFFYIFGYLLFFSKYMKNKIGILENDIDIFPHISHSEQCYLLSVQFYDVLEGSTVYAQFPERK